MSDQAVLDKQENQIEGQENGDREHDTRMFKRFGGLGVTYTFFGDPESIPDYWFD